MNQPITPERLTEIREQYIAAVMRLGHPRWDAEEIAATVMDVRDAELDRVRAERDDLKNWHDNYVKGTKFAGREIRKRLVAAESESAALRDSTR